MSESNTMQNDSLAAGRPQRNIKASQKAEAIIGTGETIPGLPFLAVSPDGPGNHDIPMSSAVPGRSTTAKGRNSRHDLRPATAMSETMQPSRVTQATFAPTKFAIYFWPVPRPTDFLSLSNSSKAWKRQTDEQEQANDIDDGSDDWVEYAPELNSSCVGRTFVNRAKRAFWSGKTWQEFETQERTINSELSITSIEHPEECLDNGFRLEVFDALKRRLCEEIWLEPYSDAPGLVKLPLWRKDSTRPGADDGTRRNIEVGPAGVSLTTSQDEADRSVVRWSQNRDGEWEPYYEGETRAPSGVKDFMDYYRGQLRGRPMADSRVDTPGSVATDGDGSLPSRGPKDMQKARGTAERGIRKEDGGKHGP